MLLKAVRVLLKAVRVLAKAIRPQKKKTSEEFTDGPRKTFLRRTSQ